MISGTAIAIAALAFFTTLVGAIPAWDAFASRDSIGSLVQDPTVIEVMLPSHVPYATLKHFFSVGAHRGEAGNAVVIPGPYPNAPEYYVSPRDGQLYHVVNSTTVLYVNVHNTTTHGADGSAPTLRTEETQGALNLAPGTRSSPLRITMGTKREGRTDGVWRWQNTMLYYEQPQRLGLSSGIVRGTNSGVYYQCADKTNVPGVFMFMEPSATPAGCTLITLHSFQNEEKKQKKRR